MIALELKFPELADKLQAGRTFVANEMIVALQTNRGMLFDAEGAFNGHDAWAPLVLRSGQIMARRGVLKKSMAPGGHGEPGPDGIARMNPATGEVTVGTNLGYAGLMNNGTEKMPDGVMRPTRAKALRSSSTRRKNPRTDKVENVIFRKSVKIPARRFDNATPQDERDFAEALGTALAEVLRG